MNELGYDSDFDVNGFSSRLLLAGRFLAELEDEMRQFLAVVNAAHTIGPFIDPTKYRDSLQREGNMDDLAELVRLARPFALKVREFQERFAPDRETERS